MLLVILEISAEAPSIKVLNPDADETYPDAVIAEE